MASKRAKNKSIESYTHQDKERSNNPPAGLVTPSTDPDEGVKTYEHDPHLDPCLSWSGKNESTSFDVPTVSLHVHERIDPCAIIDNVRTKPTTQQEPNLFESALENPPLRKAIEFYQHRHNWTNRLIAGDSLLVMNSLLEKEGMAEQVQTVYIDPPYGIRYRSNFQPFVNQTDISGGDKDDDLTGQPEQIRAFRDTWQLGVHSYLSYLRDRLILARELLSQSGSCFVQIGDENIYRVGLIMDEIFGSSNRVATISFATSSSSSSKTIPEINDYLIWFAKDKSQMKYHQLYENLDRKELVQFFSSYAMVELANGASRKLEAQEELNPDLIPGDARLYKKVALFSQGASNTGRSDDYEHDGINFKCPPGSHWSVSFDGLDRLGELNRLAYVKDGKSLMMKRYESEYPGRKINNNWSAQSFEQKKIYVVQTARKVIQRCILMSSDPGDLVFDPTCGSGTTAYVAERWGRRWITCDTSRVSLAIARQRLISSTFDYYQLAHEKEGVGSDFDYRTVSTVSAKTLAYDEPVTQTPIFDNPIVDKRKLRVTGPFTYEAVPAPVVSAIENYTTPPHLAMTLINLILLLGLNLRSRTMSGLTS